MTVVADPQDVVSSQESSLGKEEESSSLQESSVTESVSLQESSVTKSASSVTESASLQESSVTESASFQESSVTESASLQDSSVTETVSLLSTAQTSLDGSVSEEASNSCVLPNEKQLSPCDPVISDVNFRYSREITSSEEKILATSAVTDASSDDDKVLCSSDDDKSLETIGTSEVVLDSSGTNSSDEKLMPVDDTVSLDEKLLNKSSPATSVDKEVATDDVFCVEKVRSTVDVISSTNDTDPSQDKLQATSDTVHSVDKIIDLRDPFFPDEKRLPETGTVSVSSESKSEKAIEAEPETINSKILPVVPKYITSASTDCSPSSLLCKDQKPDLSGVVLRKKKPFAPASSSGDISHRLSFQPPSEMRRDGSLSKLEIGHKTDISGVVLRRRVQSPGFQSPGLQSPGISSSSSIIPALSIRTHHHHYSPVFRKSVHLCTSSMPGTPMSSHSPHKLIGSSYSHGFVSSPVNPHHGGFLPLSPLVRSGSVPGGCYSPTGEACDSLPPLRSSTESSECGGGIILPEARGMSRSVSDCALKQISRASLHLPLPVTSLMHFKVERRFSFLFRFSL